MFSSVSPITCRRETRHERPGAGSATAPAEALLAMSAGHRNDIETVIAFASVSVR
jgi:hypothetical protein